MLVKRFLLSCLFLIVGLQSFALADDGPRIGALIYNGSDIFMTRVFNSITEAADGVALIEYRDSRNSQIIQNEQVEALLEDNIDALIVNAVDRTAAVYLIRMAMERDVPIVFINREPLLEDLMLYEKAYYVGNNPQESGILCGELIVEYFRAHAEADKNGDGVIQYVMLKGEPGHQDAEYRTSLSIRTLQEAGFKLERLAEGTAMWERNRAQETMSGFLSAYGDGIECVISNNDEMALGAIESLKAAGYFTEVRTMPVVGVDATEAALNAIAEGTLWGTVLNDDVAQGYAALRLAVLLAKGEKIDEAAYPYSVDQSSIVWIPSKKITRNTLDE